MSQLQWQQNCKCKQTSWNIMLTERTGQVNRRSEKTSSKGSSHIYLSSCWFVSYVHYLKQWSEACIYSWHCRTYCILNFTFLLSFYPCLSSWVDFGVYYSFHHTFQIADNPSTKQARFLPKTYLQKKYVFTFKTNKQTILCFTPEAKIAETII